MVKFPITQKGYEKLEREIKQLKYTDRPAIIEAIATAREFGDLSENAEYDAAKEAQGLLELKISEMEKTLSNARVISQDDLDASSVVILSTVKIKQVTKQ